MRATYSNDEMASILDGISRNVIQIIHIHLKDGSVHEVERYSVNQGNYPGFNCHYSKNSIGLSSRYPFELRKNDDNTYDLYILPIPDRIIHNPVPFEFLSKTQIEEEEEIDHPVPVQTLSNEDYQILRKMCKSNSWKSYSEWITSTTKPTTFIDDRGRRFTLKHFQCELPVFNGIYHGSTTPGFQVSFIDSSLLSGYSMGIDHFLKNYKWDIPSGTIYHRTFILSE